MIDALVKFATDKHASLLCCKISLMKRKWWKEYFIAWGPNIEENFVLFIEPHMLIILHPILGAMLLCIATLITATFRRKSLNLMTLSITITTLSIVTLTIMAFDTECQFAECHVVVHYFETREREQKQNAVCSKMRWNVLAYFNFRPSARCQAHLWRSSAGTNVIKLFTVLIS